MDYDLLGRHLLETVIFSALGILVFALAFWLMAMLMPFSVRKEIEEDQNTSLGILMGSVIIGISLIIASVIQGG